MWLVSAMSASSAHAPAVCHTFEPADPWEVETPHGPGVVLYVTVYGAHANDLFCVANKEDGRLRHYQTDQISLGANHTMQVHVPVGGLVRHGVLEDGTAHRNGHTPPAKRG